MIVVRALGPAEVSVNGAAAPAKLLWKKNLALLMYLARSPKGVRTREHLTGLLWGDKPGEKARHSLNEAVHVLRLCGATTASRPTRRRCGAPPAAAASTPAGASAWRGGASGPVR